MFNCWVRSYFPCMCIRIYTRPKDNRRNCIGSTREWVTLLRFLNEIVPSCIIVTHCRSRPEPEAAGFFLFVFFFGNGPKLKSPIIHRELFDRRLSKVNTLIEGSSMYGILGCLGIGNCTKVIGLMLTISNTRLIFKRSRFIEHVVYKFVPSRTEQSIEVGRTNNFGVPQVKNWRSTVAHRWPEPYGEHVDKSVPESLFFSPILFALKWKSFFSHARK